MKTFHVVLTAVALALAGPALADKEGKGKNKDKGHESHHSAADHAPGHKGDKGKGGKKFSGGERDRIVAYFNANPAHSELPPGLAKQGKVPPGWQKKIARGQRVPDDLWAIHAPLPHEVLVKLPPPPPGVIHVRIHDHVLKVVEKTHEVLDDIGLPHPPTPRR